MLATAKRFYSRMVSFLTALVMACTTAIFTVSTASGADISADELAEMANQVAIMVNEAREEAGLDPLYVVPYLNDCATIRAEENVTLGKNISHTRPDGRGFASIVEDIEWFNINENIAAGSNTAAGAMDQWRNSPTHWATIMSENLTHMGVAVCYDPDSVYKWYWVQIFTSDLWDENAEYEGQYLPSSYVIVPADEGDVNGDAAINSFDYVTLVEYIRKKKEGTPVYFNEAQLEAADCFKDGIITEADAKCMMRYILGEYQSLPFEF